MGELRALARGVPASEWRRIIDIPDPGAGKIVTVPAQAGRAWRLLGVSCVFIASAQPGNRAIRLSTYDATGIPLAEVPITAAITAGTSRRITWQAGLGAVIVGAANSVALPLSSPLYLMPGESIVLEGGTDAGDFFADVRVIVVECYTGDVVHGQSIQQSIVDHFRAIHDLIDYR